MYSTWESRHENLYRKESICIPVVYTTRMIYKAFLFKCENGVGKVESIPIYTVVWRHQ